MKRHWRGLIKKKQEELEKYASLRLLQLKRRKEKGIKHIALVGYTNAGKTTLFNALTGKQKVMRDALFVTLDTTIGKAQLSGEGPSLTISDTIGFIQNLPPSLIETFKSTLMEAIHADLILHVADISDDKRDIKIEVVQSILTDIGASQVPQIIVFTKVDLLDEDRWSEFATLKKRYAAFSPLFLSTTERINIDALKRNIEKRVR